MCFEIDIKWLFHEVIGTVEELLACYNASIVDEDGDVTDFFFNLDWMRRMPPSNRYSCIWSLSQYLYSLDPYVRLDESYMLFTESTLQQEISKPNTAFPSLPHRQECYDTTFLLLSELAFVSRNLVLCSALVAYHSSQTTDKRKALI